MKRKITRPLLKMAGLTPLRCSSPRSAECKPDLTAIVQGMERAQSEVRPQTPYQVIREYRLFGAKSTSANAEVVAQVDFKPPTSKDYSIKSGPGAREESRSCSVS